MRKIPVSMQKVFNFARSNGRISIYQIAKALELDYKNVHAAVKRCEDLGLLSSVIEQSMNRPVRLVFVRPEIADLRIESVFLEAGSRLLERKESRRKAYFEMHGSMSLPRKQDLMQEFTSPNPTGLKSLSDWEAKPLPSISLRKKPFVA